MTDLLREIVEWQPPERWALIATILTGIVAVGSIAKVVIQSIAYIGVAILRRHKRRGATALFNGLWRETLLSMTVTVAVGWLSYRAGSVWHGALFNGPVVVTISMVVAFIAGIVTAAGIGQLGIRAFLLLVAMTPTRFLFFASVIFTLLSALSLAAGIFWPETFSANWRLAGYGFVLAIFTGSALVLLKAVYARGGNASARSPRDR